MGGLLGPGQTPFDPMMPNGLLQFLQQNPGNKMAQNMAAVAQQQPQQEGGEQPQPEMPQPQQAPQQMAPTQGPSDTGRALMDAGSAAMQAATPRGGGSLGASLGAALDVGSRSFTARKDARADAEMQGAKVDAYRRTVMSLDLPEDAKAGLLHMGVEAGAKLLAENGVKVAEPKVVADKASLVDGKGTVLYKNESGETIALDKDAQTVMRLKHTGKRVEDLTPEERDEVLNASRERIRAGAANISSSLTANPVVNNAAQKVIGGSIQSFFDRKNEFVSTIGPELASIERMQELVDGGGIMTGIFAKARATVMAMTGDVKAQNTLELLTVVTKRVLPIVRMLAPVTEEDVELLKAAKGGNLHLSQKNIDRLLELDKLAAEYRAGQLNRDALTSKVMQEEGNIQFAGDALYPMPDGRILVARRGRDKEGKLRAGTDEVRFSEETGRYMIQLTEGPHTGQWQVYK